MRIVLDLQACQTDSSRTRGVGKYAWALTERLIKLGKGHDFFVILNATFKKETIELRSQLLGLLPAEHVRAFDVPFGALGKSNDVAKRELAEALREGFIASLKPDAVITMSMFEGYHENAVTQIGPASRAVQAVILYDLIPLIRSAQYLQDRSVSEWYFRKLLSIVRADAVYAISESSRREALEHLDLAPDDVVNISSAVSTVFSPGKAERNTLGRFRDRYKIEGEIVLYTGGFDPRKNVGGLVRAFAMLPKGLIADHTLVVVCSISSLDRKQMEDLVKSFDIPANKVVFTGFIAESDLITVYRCCRLFVFPSLHEGFGLPVLEAMNCGAAVLAGDNSSLVEVVDMPEALFDAASPAAISEKMAAALSDQTFFARLKANSLRQREKFSWDRTAKALLGDLTARVCRNKSENTRVVRKRLAYVTPVTPLETGIAAYSDELLPYLLKFYDIDVVSDQTDAASSWTRANCHLISTSWFVGNYEQYDRIVYNFGNSDFHSHMFEMLKMVPGVVVLHDYFLSGVLAWQQTAHGRENYFLDCLNRAHGLAGLKDYADNGIEFSLWKYPTNADVVDAAGGIIVHSSSSQKRLRSTFKLTEGDVSLVPHLRKAPSTLPPRVRSTLLNISDVDLLICAFGILGTTKMNDELLAAFALFSRSHPRARLVFVGDGGDIGRALLDKAKQMALGDRVFVTGFASEDLYRSYLEAADIAVQLRRLSRGETSGTVLDCMSAGVPLIINAHGTLAEIDDHIVEKISEKFDVSELAVALAALAADADARGRLAQSALDYVKTVCDPKRVAKQYVEAIEGFYQRNSRLHEDKTRRRALQLSYLSSSASFMTEATASIFANSIKRRPPRLFIDVSLLAVEDKGTGIQRVVRNIVEHIWQPGLSDYRVELVRLTGHDSAILMTAKIFACRLMGLEPGTMREEVLEVADGDIFLGADLNPNGVILFNNHSAFERWRSLGAKVYFIVYDLLPLTHPDLFQLGAFQTMNEWVRAIASAADGLLTISTAVSQEVERWLDTINVLRGERDPLRISTIPLGINLAFGKGHGAPLDKLLINTIEQRRSILMVGTIEPRKRYGLALDAAEKLWKRNADFNLIIVGKTGWLSGDICARIMGHGEFGKRLFWLREASDPALRDLYLRCDLLLALSEAEGYGLPLLEAAAYRLPVVASDIPVFREKSFCSITFVDPREDDTLVRAIDASFSTEREVGSVNTSIVGETSWTATCQRIFECVSGDLWDCTWTPRAGVRVRSCDEVCKTGVGVKVDGLIMPTGQSGVLFSCPDVRLRPGRHVVRVIGGVGAGGVGEARIAAKDGLGEEPLFEGLVNPSLPVGQEVDLIEPFVLSIDIEDCHIEVVMTVDSMSDVAFLRLEILPETKA